MPRFFPTYVRSIEEDAKSKGEFIVRTVEPKFIAQVHKDPHYLHGFTINIMEWWDDSLDHLTGDKRSYSESVFLGHVHKWYYYRYVKPKTKTPA